MITGQVQIEIEAKPEVLFDLLSDPTKVSAWVPKITEMSLTPEGPIRKGFKGRSGAYNTRRTRKSSKFIRGHFNRSDLSNSNAFT